MQFSTRHRLRRGVLPALLACLALGPFLAGCAEDRSNLIPKETSDSLIGHLDRVQSLADSGQCFAAAKAALEAQQEIEAMGPEVDAELKRSLLDGVTDLTLLVNDPDKCTESDTNVDVEPTEPEEEPTDTEGTTGETGTTDTGTTTTGEQGNQNEDQDSEQPQGNGNGNEPVTPPETNPTTPTPPTTPTNPTTPPTGPGSGGLGPG